jgi:hypothetical protein
MVYRKTSFLGILNPTFLNLASEANEEVACYVLAS